MTLGTLADKHVFPDLSTIVIAGQFIDRYAMANKGNAKLGVRILYALANPLSYPWRDVETELRFHQLKHRCPKGAVTVEMNLPSPRHISTLLG